MLSKLGMMDANEATEKLTATLNGYKFSASQATEVVDKLVNVDLIAATSAEELATALQYVASQASSAGISFDQMIGLIAVGSETTRLSAETIGNTWKSVLARMEQVKAGANIDEEGESINNVEKVLNKFGIQLRDTNSQFRNMGDVLDEIGAKWETFDSVAQAQIATAVAGTHRINTFVATMENYDTVLRYTEESQDAAGTSAQKYTAYMDSIGAKLNTLTATWEQFVNNLNQSGTFKSIIDLGTKLIGVLDTLINKMGLLKVVLPAAVITVLVTKVKGLIQHFTKLGATTKSVQTILGALKTTTSLSSETTQELGVALAGLTLKERVAVLNTTNLTDAQKELVLVASGIPAAEAAAEIAIQNVGNSSKKAAGDINDLTAGMKISAGANKLGIVIGGITTALTVGKAIIDAYNQSVQESIDKAHELESTYRSFTTETNSSISSLTSVKEEFNQLSVGVTDYGENIALSAEQYQRYKDIVAQVLEATPQLIEGYNSEGAAIANKNGLIEDSISLLQEQQDLELREFVAEDIPDIGKGLRNALKEAEGELTSAKYNFQQSLKSAIILDKSSVEGGVNELRGQILNAFKKDDGTFYEIGELVRTRTEDVYKYLLENTDKLTKESLAKINSNAEKQAIALVKVGEAQEALNPSLQIVPKVVKGYSELDDSTKQFISNYISQFKLADNQSEDTWEQWTQDIKAFTGNIISLGPDIQNAISSIFSLDPASLPVDEYREQINSMLNTVLNSIEGVDDETKAKIKTSVMVQLGLTIIDEDGNEIGAEDQLKTNLKEKFKFLTDEDLSKWTLGDLKLGLQVPSDGISSVQQLTSAMQELNAATEETGPTFEDAQSAINSALGDFASTAQTLTSSYSTLTTAMNEFNNNGVLSAETLKKLTDNDLIQYLSIVNGKVQINTQALSDNLEAAKQKAKQDVLQNAFNQLLALSENQATEAAINSVEASATAATEVELMGQAFGRATGYITSATKGLDLFYSIIKKKKPSIYSAQEKNIMKDALNYMNLIDQVSLSAGGGTGSGGSSSASNKIKEQKQNIEDLIEAFIKMYKQQLKEEKEAENSRYEQVKRDYEDEQNAQKHKFEDAKQNLEDLRDLEKEAYQDRLDALENEYKAYTKKLDAQKDLLKAKKEEADYEKSLAEKTKSVAQIQSELTKLQFDDSIEAQKKRIELMEQLSEKQSDLDEFQSDHQYDLAEDAIDKESDRYKDAYDERKKLIEDERDTRDKFYEDELDALDRAQTKWQRDFDYRKQQDQRWHEDKINQIEDEINDEVTLRAQAIEAIESRNEEAYQKLIEWNRVYGTGIDYDITQKWNVAMAALDEYGKKGIGVQGILDILAQKVDEIASKTSSAGSGFGSWPSGIDRANSSLRDTIKNLKEIKNLGEQSLALRNPTTKLKQSYTKYHTGTDYVSVNANDRLLNKSLGLKSDEVVRILKVGEAVIPKERNLKRLRENSLFAETNAERRTSELTEGSRGYVADNSSHINVSIGDTIVQGNADNNVVSRLNEYKKSIVNEVFTKINKHTDLSGFRSVKKYV